MNAYIIDKSIKKNYFIYCFILYDIFININFSSFIENYFNHRQEQMNT